MAKKYGKITVEAFAPTRDGGLVDVDTLDASRRRGLATELSVGLLNAAYAGTGVKVSAANKKEGDIA